MIWDHYTHILFIAELISGAYVLYLNLVNSITTKTGILQKFYVKGSLARISMCRLSTDLIMY